MDEKAKQKRLGIFLLAGPIVLLVGILVMWAVVQQVAAVTGNDITTLVRVINLVLSFLGIIAVLGLMFGPIIGITLIMNAKKADQKGNKKDEDLSIFS